MHVSHVFTKTAGILINRKGQTRATAASEASINWKDTKIKICFGIPFGILNFNTFHILCLDFVCIPNVCCLRVFMLVFFPLISFWALVCLALFSDLWLLCFALVFFLLFLTGSLYSHALRLCFHRHWQHIHSDANARPTKGIGLKYSYLDEMYFHFPAWASYIQLHKSLWIVYSSLRFVGMVGILSVSFPLLPNLHDSWFSFIKFIVVVVVAIMCMFQGLCVCAIYIYVFTITNAQGPVQKHYRIQIRKVSSQQHEDIPIIPFMQKEWQRIHTCTHGIEWEKVRVVTISISHQIASYRSSSPLLFSVNFNSIFPDRLNNIRLCVD